MCPLKSFNLRRFFRWALGSRGGTCPKCPPPLGYAPAGCPSEAHVAVAQTGGEALDARVSPIV